MDKPIVATVKNAKMEYVFRGILWIRKKQQSSTHRYKQTRLSQDAGNIKVNTSFHSCEWTKYSQTWSLKLKRNDLHSKKKVICESFIQQVNDPRDEVEGNIRTLGKTILTAPSGPGIKCIISNYFISSRTSRIYTCILNGRNQS